MSGANVRTFEATTKLRFPTGHGTITQSSAKLSGTSNIHSDNISYIMGIAGRRIYSCNIFIL